MKTFVLFIMYLCSQTNAADCKYKTLQLDMDFTVDSCIISGQAEAAKYLSEPENRDWTLKEWRCTISKSSLPESNATDAGRAF